MQIPGAMGSCYKCLILHERTRDVIQTASRRLISDAFEVFSQFLNDGDCLGLLNRGFVFGNQDGLLRFDEDATVSLVSLTARWRPGECVI